jgi:lambda family phage minor tail protein L
MSNLFLLTNSEVIDLFEIKLNDFEGYLYFHGSKNFEKDLVFQGRTYLYIPCEMSNLQYGSDGKQNRPVIKISNVNNFISNLIKDRGNLLGKEFNRKKMLAKDLDAVNFDGASKNPLGSSSFKDFISNDKFVVNKKNSENKERVEFELSNILDIDGLTCPSRKVYNNTCQWQYRGHGCNYGKILNYDGPNVQITKPTKTSLEAVLDLYTGDSIKNYLGVWLDSNGLTTSSDLTKYRRASSVEYGGVYSDLFFNTALDSWVNKAGTLNTSAADGVITTQNMTWSNDGLGPIIFTNSGRLKNNSGVCPVRPNFGYQAVKPNSSFLKLNLLTNYDNKDLTIFYVFEPTTIFVPTRGYLGRALETEDLETYIGVHGGNSDFYRNKSARLDSFQIKNSDNRIISNRRFSNHSAARPSSSAANIPVIYSCSIPKDNNGDISFYKNGFLLNSLTPNYSSGSHGIDNLGFNKSVNTSSHIVIYEVIIFEKQLTQKQIESINTYLGNKYGISTAGSDISSSKGKPSSDFFNQNGEDGNLGVPMSDENDKMFFKSYDDKLKYYDSYGLEDLIYKGDYNSKTVYQKGDFVKIDANIDFDFTKDSLTQNSELPHRFFICISQQGSKGINPLDNSIIWKEDKCSKSLSGCSLRFGSDQEIAKKIPFGGFPGTVDYDYELPS